MIHKLHLLFNFALVCYLKSKIQQINANALEILCVSVLVPVSQKQRPKRVKAMYNCVADNPDELTFSEGEVIVVDGEEDQEWWVSICHVEDSVCKLFCASWMFARVFRFEILNIL